MRMKGFCAVAVAAAVSVALTGEAGAATTIDFESLLGAEGTLVTNQISGVTFTNAYLIHKGGSPAGAFGGPAGNDAISSPADAFGNRFISNAAFNNAASANIEFSFAGLVDNLSLQVGDLDVTEAVTVRTYNALNQLLETVSVNYASPGAGNGNAVTVTTTIDGIKRVVVDPTPSASSGLIGWGIDNITFDVQVVVPEPASLMLLAPIVAMMRRRR